MKTFLKTIVPLYCAGALAAHAAFDRYVEEYPFTIGIPPSASNLLAELRDEIAKILAAGRLAPLRIHYADEIYRGYYLYTETLRDLITIGAAYPYLSPSQQSAARAFVRTQCINAVWWSMIENPPTNGARRELYVTRDPLHGWGHRYGMDIQNRPRVAGLIGLELYARTSGDWPLISNYWSNILDYYSRNDMWGGSLGYQGDLYGTLGAHIAVARMAAMVGDTAARSQALARLSQQFPQHTNFAAIVNRSTNWYYSFLASDRAAPLIFHGWLFLNITPEVCRFIDDRPALRAAALAHIDAGQHLFPLWWLHQAPYWTRWTGDEGMGLSPEILGMIFPLERWVRRTSHHQLAAWLSAPVGRGDCYYIESLINALEAHGTTVWTRFPTAPCALLAPNGGEVLPELSSVPISWHITSTVTSVNLELSDDDFLTTSLIASNVPNSGLFLWTTPPAFFTNARIRVSASDNPALFDTSDRPFVIIPEPVGLLLLLCPLLLRRSHF